MDKIKFSKGGQPVFLDDLQLLQDNYISIVSFLVESARGSAAPVLLRDYNPILTQINDDGTINVAVEGNDMLHEGVIFSIQPKEFKRIQPLDKIYVSVGFLDHTPRVFQSGETNNVRTSGAAVLFSSKIGDTSYLMDDLFRFGGIRSRKIALYNGYVGYVSVYQGKLLISIEGAGENWDNDYYRLFSVSDKEWVAALADKTIDLGLGSGLQITFDSTGLCSCGYQTGNLRPFNPPKKIQATLTIPQ